MKKVEQVNINGEIVQDYDNKLSREELFKTIKTFFPNIYKDNDDNICGEFEGNKYAIRVKNVTYLGNPHPKYKKRIQISNDLQSFYNKAIDRGQVPILLGVYTYKENLVFVDFNIIDFIDKKAHNSSAHIYTEDLAAATEDKYFHKEDNFGNNITAFTPAAVNAFLEEKMLISLQLPSDGEKHAANNNFDLLDWDYYGFTNQLEMLMKDFFSNEPPIWNGKDCYKKMITDNYRNKFQSEWAGFYLEYTFEKYIEKNNLRGIVDFYQAKKKDNIDLDLIFRQVNMYGDLKSHSSNLSTSIQGNDLETIKNIITNPDTENHIFYLVCDHFTVKDSEHNYEVTKYWNQAQGKKDLMSYHKKMKHHVELEKMYILDIHRGNMQYLTKYNQGINSNGKPRKPKIMIEERNLSKFVIAEQKY